MAKYDMVFKHDRAGRLVDAQEFRRIRLPNTASRRTCWRSSSTECAENVQLEGDDLIVDHVYIERRMTPLNLYVRSATPDAGRTRGDRLRAMHSRPCRYQHLRRRPAAQELRRHAPRTRDLLRLRRALPRHRLPLPRRAAGDFGRGRDARRKLVLRRRERRVPGDLPEVPRLRGTTRRRRFWRSTARSSKPAGGVRCRSDSRPATWWKSSRITLIAFGWRAAFEQKMAS